MSDNDREMSGDHNVWLHQALGMQMHEVLPAKLVDKYWELKRIYDRTNVNVQQRDIAFMCWQMGFGKATEKEKQPPTVVELYRKKQLKVGETIGVKWRDKWVDATLVGVTGNDEIIAQPVGEADERRFKAEDVQVPVLA
jgi:hypothetical protein